MRRTRLVIAALAALAVAPASAAAATPRTLEVVARQGQEARAIAAIHQQGGRITLRRGRTLQIQVPAGHLSALRRSRGVRGAGPVAVGFADSIISQGVYRTGADVLQAEGLKGDGVKIAVLDLGFGTRWQSKLGTELPPASGIDATQSFDMTTGQPGIAGLSSSDTPTSHGESVAEVVHDMAPDATLTLVNYHTELEFDQAVDWLINGPGGKPRVDIVVHSNSFLDGPFDGTGPTAQEVDKAEAAGILWVNSAGNYGQRHWDGTVGDEDGDTFADMTDQDGLTFSAPANEGVGATLEWSDCTVDGLPSAASSVGYNLDVTGVGATGTVPLAQGLRDATRPLEIVSWTAPVAGRYELRAQLLTAGSRCNLNVFVGGVDLDQPVTAGSIPTPGDATGSLTVGAFDWQSGILAPYSSQGPTPDGRLKPELIAPASTTVSPGLAMVGTSASAPHVAGAAALLIQRARATGQPSDPTTITQLLESMALDVGPPGPDDATGYGKLRLDLTAPVVRAVWPSAGESVSGVIHPRIQVIEAGTLQSETMTLDGVLLAPGLAEPRIDTRLMPDGPHVLAVTATDMSGNVGVLSLPFTVDNTPPTIGTGATTARRAGKGSSDVTITDAGTGDGYVVVTRDQTGGVFPQTSR
ncbi:MAG: S8 family serine peptidase, partial [Gaiellales bacterium]